jgi:hypothetical protein
MRYPIGLLMLCMALFAYFQCSINNDNAVLDNQITSLREEIKTTPTTGGNFNERLRVAHQWYMLSGDSFAEKMSPIGWESFYERNKNSVEPPQEENLRRLDEFLQQLDFADGRASEIATIRMETSDRAIAYQYGTWTMVLNVGKLGIVGGGSITVHHKNTSNWGSLQTTEPSEANYLTASTTGAAALEIDPHRMFPRMFEGQSSDRLQITIQDGRLVEGDEVRIVFGDRSGGGPGRQVQGFSENDSRYYTLIDYQGNGVYNPIGWGAVNVEGAEAAAIVAVVPAIVKPGESFPVKIKVEDRYRNFASNYSGTIQISVGTQIVSEVSISSNDTPAATVDITVPLQSGIVRLTVEDKAHGLTGISNPLRVDSSSEMSLYWGELHGHTAITDGIGTTDEFYSFARDQAFCDFAALSEHCQWISDKEWKEMQVGANAYNYSGKFVALVAYEWTQNPIDGGGHHNVYFFGDGGPLIRRFDARTKQELFRGLEAQMKNETVLVIPHAHSPGDWRKKDHVMERFAEIYSKQGVFEWFGNRFLENNYVGFVAASDDHTGHPGNAPAITYWRCNGGLTAVYAEKLTRSGLDLTPKS